MQDMTSSQMTIVRNGEQLALDVSFAEAKIKDQEILAAYGALNSSKIAQVGRVLSFFKRFRDFHTSNSWCVGHQRWDGVKFIPNQNIKVYGMGLFERHPSGGQWKLGYKYKLYDQNDNMLLDSETWEEEVDPNPADVVDHIIKH